MSKFNLDTYRIYIQMSHKKHILVEGESDKLTLEVLMQVFDENDCGLNCEIEIECAEDITSPVSCNGNRKKVEMICNNMPKTEDMSNKFVGFVDREFRGFSFDDELIDTINTHNLEDNVLWTRGHSIENYFFIPDVLRMSFRSLTTATILRLAIKRFECIFESAIKLISSLSFACQKSDISVSKIISIIHYRIIDINNCMVTISKRNIKDGLLQRNINIDSVEGFITDFDMIHDIISDSKLETLKWYCHGHLGIIIFRHIFAKCIFMSCRNDAIKTTHNSFLRSSEKVFCHNCANSWAQLVIDNDISYPKNIFEIFNIALNIN